MHQNGDFDLYLQRSPNKPYPGFAKCFANGVPADQAPALLPVTQRPLAFSATTKPSGPPAWKTTPSWSVIGTARPRDRAGAEQEAMSERAGAHITKIPTPATCPLISRAGVVARGHQPGRPRFLLFRVPPPSSPPADGAILMPDSTTPVVFIHGLWLHATSWEPGSSTSSSRLRSNRAGMARRPADRRRDPRDPSLVADFGIDDVTERYIADRRPGAPADSRSATPSAE